jgi:hypothetical protein
VEVLSSSPLGPSKFRLYAAPCAQHGQTVRLHAFRGRQRGRRAGAPLMLVERIARAPAVETERDHLRSTHRGTCRLGSASTAILLGCSRQRHATGPVTPTAISVSVYAPHAVHSAPRQTPQRWLLARTLGCSGDEEAVLYRRRSLTPPQTAPLPSIAALAGNTPVCQPSGAALSPVSESSADAPGAARQSRTRRGGKRLQVHAATSQTPQPPPTPRPPQACNLRSG